MAILSYTGSPERLKREATKEQLRLVKRDLKKLGWDQMSQSLSSDLQKLVDKLELNEDTAEDFLDIIEDVYILEETVRNAYRKLNIVQDNLKAYVK